MPARAKKKKESPGPFTVAGLVRFYEEADVGIKIKPHIVIAISMILAIMVIVVQKIMPIS